MILLLHLAGRPQRGGAVDTTSTHLIKKENKSNTSKKSNIPLFFNLFYFL